MQNTPIREPRHQIVYCHISWEQVRWGLIPFSRNAVNLFCNRNQLGFVWNGFGDPSSNSWLSCLHLDLNDSIYSLPSYELIVGQAEFLAWLDKQSRKTKFKPVVICLKIDLVLHPTCVGGFFFTFWFLNAYSVVKRNDKIPKETNYFFLVN